MKIHVKFFDVLSLKALEVSAIERRVSQQLRGYFISVSAGAGGLVPTAAWSQIIDAVKVERPWLTSDIDHLLDWQRFSETRWVGKIATLLSEERDALGVSLDIFSRTGELRGRVLSSWVPRDGAFIVLKSKLKSPKSQQATATAFWMVYLQNTSAKRLPFNTTFELARHDCQAHCRTIGFRKGSAATRGSVCEQKPAGKDFRCRSGVLQCILPVICFCSVQTDAN